MGYNPKMDSLDKKLELERQSRSDTVRFRLHFIAVMVGGLLLAGVNSPSEVAMLPWALAMDFGPWVHPLNLIFSLFVVVAITVIQVMKLKRPESIGALRDAQLWIWWPFWLLFGMACRFGNWAGP